MRVTLALALALLILGCQEGGGSSGGAPSGNTGPTPVPVVAGAPLIVTAGVETLDPEADGTPVTSQVDLSAFGISDVSSVYDLTTPVDAPFAFHVFSREEGNTGPVKISLAHVLAGTIAPVGGVSSIAEAGLIPSVTGSKIANDWIEVDGDGFARLTLQGAIEEQQVLLVKTESSAGSEYGLIRVRPGPTSKINLESQGTGNYPGTISESLIYSSDSWQFGLPTLAISGDRSTIVAYEGDLNDPQSSSRYEMRIQHDKVTGDVTGGASVEQSPDSGNWRDHEIAALYNVLALVRSGVGQVTVSLSFDRGATFAQTETFTGSSSYSPRLVQITMALDYTLAVLFWRTNSNMGSDLILVEGQPSAYDNFGSPSAYAFSQPEVVYSDAADVTPFIMDAAYSAGGDLVFGYGFTRTWSNGDGSWTSRTEYHCGVRLFGQQLEDTVVEEIEITGFDPTIGIIGQGPTMSILYAYESDAGIRLQVSHDAGQSFQKLIDVGDQTAHLPTLLVRDQNGKDRVDLVYLGYGQAGTELHLVHWDDFSLPASFGAYRLTTATMEETQGSGGGPVPGGVVGIAIPSGGFRTTQISWLGYDAVVDGDDVVIVYDEQTWDAYLICMPFGGPALAGAPMLSNASFVAATPPPLAPGLTLPVATPNPDHMHRLKLLRLD